MKIWTYLQDYGETMYEIRVSVRAWEGENKRPLATVVLPPIEIPRGYTLDVSACACRLEDKDS